jgi:hypothetical protein
MLSPLTHRAGWMLAVALAVARGDGRTGSSARAGGAAAEVDWLSLALDDSAPSKSGLSSFGVELVQQLDSSVGWKRGDESDQRVVSA